MILVMIPREMGRISRDTRVIIQLMENIITRIPTSMVALVISWVMLWFRLWLRVSISLVIRDSTSPWVWPSKYRIGILPIFSEIFFRKR